MFPRWMQCQIRVCVSTVVAEIVASASENLTSFIEEPIDVRKTAHSVADVDVM